MAATDPSTNANESGILIVYGHAFCGQARTLRRALESANLDFEWRDVRQGDPEFQEELRGLANGFLSVPTVVFPDGTVMVEPRTQQVIDKARPGGGSSLIGRLFKR